MRAPQAVTKWRGALVVWKVAKWVEGVKKIGHSASKTMTCPSCHNETGIGTAALFDHVFMSRKKCKRCGRDFLIVDGIPMTEEQYARRSRDTA